jgi:hypothetical protein
MDCYSYVPALRGKRLTIAGMMVLIAIVAGLANLFRPITRSEAMTKANLYFRQVPGVSAWNGSYKIHAWQSDSTNYGDQWTVDFIDSDDHEHLAQITVTFSGTIVGPGINLDKLRRPKFAKVPASGGGG